MKNNTILVGCIENAKMKNLLILGKQHKTRKIAPTWLKLIDDTSEVRI